MCLDGKDMAGEFQIGRGQMEVKPEIVANQEGLVEFAGKCVEKSKVGSSGNRGIDNGEGDCTYLFGKNFQANRETGIGFSEDGDGQVGPANADQVTLWVGSGLVPRGVKSPSVTGKWRRTLG